MSKTQHHNFGKERRPWNNPIANPPKGRSAFLPLPAKTKTNLTLDLETILPGITDEIRKTGKLVWHMVGDTGGIHGTETQEALASAMEAQLDVDELERPRFLYHLGDVVYFNGQSDGYASQFYEPYQHLNYPIFAIPGNHDNGGDPKLWASDGANDGTAHPLKGFMDNFCAPRADYLFKHRTAMTQPYCYWVLNTPLARIIGLNSNVDGLLDAPGTTEQEDWFHDQLAVNYLEAKNLVAVHHCPYSLDSNHGGYGAIAEALNSRPPGATYAAVFSGHVHNYQRFSKLSVPYVIAGAGGYANNGQGMHKLPEQATVNPGPAIQTTLDEVYLMKYNQTAPGFLRITASRGAYSTPPGLPTTGYKGEYFVVPFGETKAQLFDTFAF